MKRMISIGQKMVHWILARWMVVCTVCCLASCADDLQIDLPETPQGVDMSRMVEVTLPFSVSKGIQADITTRSTDTDSELSGIMVFVYERTGNPEKDKRVAWYLFSNPAHEGDLDHSIGGWTPNADGDASKGSIKFHVPLGDCYIYLIGNASGSFLQFFPGVNPNEGDPLATLKGFWENGNPKWTGNMDKVDGYLPLVGTVNNASGACTVFLDENDKDPQGNPKVKIKYKKDNQDEVTFDPNVDPKNDDERFTLKRLMSKVSVNIQDGEGVTFVPKDYRFRHVAQYVSPVESARQDDASFLNQVVDTKAIPFSTQSPNSFTVYLPENLVNRKEGVDCQSFADREAIVKAIDEHGSSTTNQMETEEGHQEHYLFKNAPKHSTYLELTGRFEGIHEGTPVSADARYFIHLGDFGKDLNDFNLRRDYHYTYNVTVKGVDNIYVEVNSNTEAPGAEAVVFEGGARATLDAHYEQVEMKFTRGNLEKGVYVYAHTPYGTVQGKYSPNAAAGNRWTENTVTLEEAKKQLKWIEFIQEEGAAGGNLATYQPEKALSIFDALQNTYNEGTGTAYYTCFVDEYFYNEHPLTQASVKLSDFINADDRVFSVGSDIKYSNDGKSAIVQAVYALQQRSIACFYDLSEDSKNVAKYGVETVDETGKLTYGSPRSSTTDLKDGRQNTIIETQGHRDQINWAKNGWLLQENADGTIELKQGTGRLNSNSAHLACLSRNRDWNGNGSIEDGEIRWYNPALHQLLGLWVGESALPAEAALFTQNTSVLDGQNSQVCHYPIFSSTGGDYRILWSEQGCSYGPDNRDPYKGNVRAVRNLGKEYVNEKVNNFVIPADPFYTYNPSDRTITVHLNDIALRAYSSRELAPHHERSAINRPPKVFQVAAHPFVVQVTEKCGGGAGHLTHGSFTYNQLQTSSCKDATTASITLAAKYPGSGESMITSASWRLPNQRELALMAMAMATTKGELDYPKEGDYWHMDADCGFLRPWYTIDNKLLQCRTQFSNASYAYSGANGYMYNSEANLIQLFWRAGGGNQDLGQGDNGTAGYLCVRDVQ